MRWLSWNEAIKGALIQTGWYPYKRRTFRSTGERLWEDTARRRLSASQGERPWKKPNLSTRWSWATSLQNRETIHFSCWSHPVCGILTAWANTACKPHAGDSGMRLTHCVVSPTGLRTLPCVHIYVYLVNEWSLLSVLISIIIYFISQTHG